MLGVAVRLAQRMGLHSESSLAKCSTFEAEMRRRLWWSIVLFDSRIGERAGAKVVALDPTWDCKPPSNVNDSDLRPEMNGPLKIQMGPTDSIFALIRSEIADFVRHTDFYLDFTTPALKPIAKVLQESSRPEDRELNHLEDMLERRYLTYCDPENPVHFMTMWTARSQLAKYRLLEHHARFSGSTRPTDAQHNAATNYALRTIECDLKILSSPLTKAFFWLHRLYFPFPAFFQVLQNLKRRPLMEQAEQAWQIMGDDHLAWLQLHPMNDGPFFQIFAKIVLQAWGARESVWDHTKGVLTPPRLVTFVRHYLSQTASNFPDAATEQDYNLVDQRFGDLNMSLPMGFPDQTLPYLTNMQSDTAGMSGAIPPNISGQPLLDAAMNDFDWSGFTGQHM